MKCNTCPEHCPGYQKGFEDGQREAMALARKILNRNRATFLARFLGPEGESEAVVLASKLLETEAEAGSEG